jgi:hypothetical protein
MIYVSDIICTFVGNYPVESNRTLNLIKKTIIFQDRCRASHSAWAPGTRSVGWRKTLMDSLPGPSRHYQCGIFYEYNVLCKLSISGFLSCDMTCDVNYVFYCILIITVQFCCCLSPLLTFILKWHLKACEIISRVASI